MSGPVGPTGGADPGPPEEPGPESGGPGPGGGRPDRVAHAVAESRRRLRTGVWLSAAGVAALAVTTSLPFLDVLALPAFYLLLPALAVAQLPLLHVERLERVPVYVGSMIAILTLGAVGALLASRLEGVAPAGMSALPTAELLLWTAGLVVGGLVVVAAFHPLDRRARGGAPEVLRDLIPRTPRERGLFGALSISAGVGEELAYRGYAFQVIQLLGLGPWGAALASSLPFGCLHAYQGPVGVVRTAVMGVVLAVPVVLTGSLLPSMAAHALLDIILGIVLGDRLMGGNGRGTERDDRSDLVPREHGE